MCDMCASLFTIHLHRSIFVTSSSLCCSDPWGVAWFYINHPGKIENLLDQSRCVQVHRISESRPNGETSRLTLRKNCVLTLLVVTGCVQMMCSLSAAYNGQAEECTLMFVFHVICFVHECQLETVQCAAYVTHLCYGIFLKFALFCVRFVFFPENWLKLCYFHLPSILKLLLPSSWIITLTLILPLHLFRITIC